LDIDQIREQIDDLDDQLLDIFSRRAALALEIGKIKQQRGLAVYDGRREQQIFARMQQANPGPLDDGAIQRLFERVIDESRRLERLRSKGE
jgi:chorismate mutase